MTTTAIRTQPTTGITHVVTLQTMGAGGSGRPLSGTVLPMTRQENLSKRTTRVLGRK